MRNVNNEFTMGYRDNFGFVKHLRAYPTNRRLPTNHQVSDLGQCFASMDHDSFDVEAIVAFDWKALDHYWELHYCSKLDQRNDPRTHGNRRRVYGRVRRVQDCLDLNSVCGYLYFRC